MLYNKSWVAPLLPRKDYWANKWVQWKHNMVGLFHCPTCIALNGCYFLFVNAPPCPHHEKCHCELIAIDFSVVERNATAHSKFSKFDPYLFNTNGMYWHGKEKLFAEWGYSAEDAHWLQSEMERQAIEKYVSGNCQLGNLNLFGQRINIRIEIPRKDGWGTVSFISGWMVKPNGKLELTTPYGGK